jgi:preprotein translocase subunit SecG
MNWITTTLLVFQASSALLLILLVLLHSPKSDGAGLLGGVASSFTTQQGAENTLNKLTRFMVTVFIVISFILGYYAN